LFPRARSVEEEVGSVRGWQENGEQKMIKGGSWKVKGGTNTGEGFATQTAPLDPPRQPLWIHP